MARTRQVGTWSKRGAAAGGASCTAGPSTGNVSESIDLPVGGSATYTVVAKFPKAYLPKIYEAERVDEILDVTEDAAQGMTLRLAREEGIFVGHSAGGAVAAAVDAAAALNGAPAMMAIILPDRGDKYLSSDLFR